MGADSEPYFTGNKMGIIKINNQTFCVTEGNRFRSNWKNDIRKPIGQRERKKIGICLDCGKKRLLTIHHEPPLNQEVFNNKKIRICEECHKIRHSNKKFIGNNGIIKCLICNGRNYFDGFKIKCSTCGYERMLQLIKENEYKTI